MRIYPDTDMRSLYQLYVKTILSPVESHRTLHCQLHVISGKLGRKIVLNVMHDADSRDLWIASRWDLRPF